MAVVVGEAAVRIRADADPKQIEDDSSGPIMDALGKLGGKGAALLGGALGGLALADAFGTAMENGKLEDKFSARLGLTEDRSAQIGDLAGSLYAQNYGDSMEDVYGSVEAVMTSIDGMSTASQDALEAMTARAMNFASAFDVDVTAATQTAGNLIKNGLAKDGTQAFDLLTRSFQTVPAAMREELPAILDEYGTNFRALGFTGEQAFGLLGHAAEGGAIVLDKTGDALKEFSIRGSDMSATSVAAYQAIGLNANKMSDAIAKGGAPAQDALQKTAQAILGITDPADRANAAIALFGTPLEDLSVDQIPSFLNAIATVGPGMEGAAGASDRLGQTLNDNASSNLATFGRQASQLAVNFLGGQLLPAVDTITSTIAAGFGPALSVVAGIVTDYVIPAVQTLGGFIADHSTTFAIIAGIITAVFIPALVSMAAESVTSAAITVGGWIATQAAAIASAAAQGFAFFAMIGGWVLAAGAAVLNAGLVVGSWIGMGIAAGVQAAIVGAVWLAQTVATGAVMVASWVATAATVVAGWVGMAAVAAVNALAVGAVWLAQTIATTAAMIAGWAVAAAAVVGGWIVMAATALVQAAAMAAAWFIALGPIGWVIAAVIGLVALIVANWDTVKTYTVEAFDAVVGAVKAAWQWVLDVTTTIVGAVVGFVQAIPGRFVDALSALGSLIAGVASTAWQWFLDNVAAKIGEAVIFVGGLPGKIVSAIGNLGGLLVQKGRDLIQGLVDGIAGAAGYVGNVARNIVNGIIGFINSTVIDGINGLLEFTIMGVHINPPDIPHIPRLHSGGVFDSGQGEGLALLRDDELVATPGQRRVADTLLRNLLDGTLDLPQTAATPAAAGPNVQIDVHPSPGMDERVLAAHVSSDIGWQLSSGSTRTVPLLAVP